MSKLTRQQMEQFADVLSKDPMLSYTMMARKGGFSMEDSSDIIELMKVGTIVLGRKRSSPDAGPIDHEFTMQLKMLFALTAVYIYGILQIAIAVRGH